MKILAIESSGNVASTAVLEDGIIKSEFTINNRLTHSETLLPMIREMEKISGVNLSDCDAVAVSKGPGSFTGLRIGAATAKGLCLAWGKPVIRVSSLMAMALNIIEDTDKILQDTDNKKVLVDTDNKNDSRDDAAVICPIMDARRGQIYGAAYDRKLFALIPDGAYDLNEFLEKLLENTNNPGVNFVFLGDGVPVHREKIKEKLSERAVFASAHVCLQRASSVAVLGSILYKKHLSKESIAALENEVTDSCGFINAAADSGDYANAVVDSDDFVPDYFRKTQAEREMSEGILEDPGLHSLKKIGRGK